MSPLKKCVLCGGRIVIKTGPGRFMRYKAFMEFEVPEYVAIPTCQGCGSEYVDRHVAETIDAACESFHAQELRRRVEKLLDRILDNHFSQLELNTLLGLSHGYLSKIKHGKRAPSVSLVALLALIANDRSERVEELKRFWGKLLTTSAPDYGKEKDEGGE